ncbi:hypothetical protein J3R82DRAFT_6905 [Butyriboletus roseoflavus]|nr:hypothetical protein J3R82DRAFT_6905 [Butyriboletus roseoflavus]
MHTTAMPAPVIKNATTIWDIGVNWPLSSQCGTWDAKGRGVDVWECILARMSIPPPWSNPSSSYTDYSTPATSVCLVPLVLLDHSLSYPISLRTPSTGGTSDVDSRSTLVDRSTQWSTTPQIHHYRVDIDANLSDTCPPRRSLGVYMWGGYTIYTC